MSPYPMRRYIALTYDKIKDQIIARQPAAEK
jgi:hypothetical protein